MDTIDYLYDEPAPTAKEARPDWAVVPPAAVVAVEDALGPIVGAETVHGGYSAAATWRLRTARGTVFAKARHPGQTPMGVALVDAERRAYAELPEIAAFAPAFLGAVEADGWAFLFLEDVAGAPALPWTPAKAKAALARLATLNRTVPRDPPAWLAPVAAAQFTAPLLRGDAGWVALAEDAEARQGVAGLFAPGWLDGALGRLVALEARGRAIRGPAGLLHMDVRSDNLLFRESPVLLDWPYVCLGPALTDLGFFLPSLVGESGLAPAPLVAAYAEALGAPVPSDDLAAALALATGYFADLAHRRVPPGMPRVRWVQRLQLLTGLKLIAALGEITPPPPSPSPPARRRP